MIKVEVRVNGGEWVPRREFETDVEARRYVKGLPTYIFCDPGPNRKIECRLIEVLVDEEGDATYRELPT